MYEERFEKLHKIGDKYSREYRQEDIAKEFGIPVSVVRKATKALGYEHGKLKKANNPNNLNSGQKQEAVICGNELGFLDKYEF